MNNLRAPAQGLALLSLCAVAALTMARMSQAQMRTSMQGYRYTTLPMWRVDLDQAGVDELAALPGVGPSLAAAIVADRQAKGPFKTLAELDRVRGVGPAVLQQIQPFVLQLPE
ncbi:MAG: helix-hairpin-helix domain-containing protein [Phycisphaerales bacterium]|nr:helix-hairpin-helix domain-containing protein [Phycisphaerales bacterium]